MILSTAECRVVEKALKDRVGTLTARMHRAQIEGRRNEAEAFDDEREIAFEILDRLEGELG